MLAPVRFIGRPENVMDGLFEGGMRSFTRWAGAAVGVGVQETRTRASGWSWRRCVLSHIVIQEIAPPVDLLGPFPDHEVLVLPESIRGDVGVYRDEALVLVKEMKAEGIDAEYLHDPERREWHGLRSQEVVVVLTLSFAAGLLANATWDAIKGVVNHLFGKRNVIVRFHERRTDNEEEKWFEASGPADSVIDSIREFKAGRGDDSTAAG
jgi:hypothetical protein